MRRLRVLTWLVHGSYLANLARVPHEVFLPVKPIEVGRPPGYGGRGASFDWGPNVHEVPAEDVAGLQLDCVVYQSARNWVVDREEILSPSQRALPSVFVEHDPPRQSPTDTRHPVDDPDVLLVHVTHFNQLMWDSGRTPTRVIEHGVDIAPAVVATGERPRGVVVVNGLRRRGRRLGADVFTQVRDQRRIPLDLVGMESEELGGLGEVMPRQLHEHLVPYRFFFNPIRYTSLGLAVCEAMMIGLPIVGLATTEMVTVVESGRSGYLDTDVARLVEHMRRLLRDRDEAHALGMHARRVARERFALGRFLDDWCRTLADVTDRPRGVASIAPGDPDRSLAERP